MLASMPRMQNCDVRIEVRTTDLKAMRQKRGLTQRQLGRDLGLSLHYIPAIEEGARRGSPKLHGRLVKYFGCRFEDLFEVVLVDPQRQQEQVLQPRHEEPPSTFATISRR
jgi:DNA-binding XRE family transcriptional regulator